MIYMAVDMVDTPSDVTDPDTLIIPVEHHPTASDEATCTTALQSTHGTDQHTTGERCHLSIVCIRSSVHVNIRSMYIIMAYTVIASVMTDSVPSGVTEGDTSQDVLTSCPHANHSGMYHVWIIILKLLNFIIFMSFCSLIL